jgi:hypothetical protein
MYIGNKRISLNMNWYRNAHYQVLAKIKREFSPGFPFPRFKAEKINVKYTLVCKTKKRTDRMNWIAIVDKFFLDWLVNNGYISDDDIFHYGKTTATARHDSGAAENYIIAEVSET